jgi:CheY-like chemotaxis protein
MPPHQDNPSESWRFGPWHRNCCRICVEMTHMTRKILVVDDEPDVVRYFKTLLEDSGFDVVTAVDGAQAMEKIRAERPDLVTLDITMPNRSGVRVYRDIKENDRLRSIPVVVVTGVQHEFKEFISTRTQVPAPDAYLEKPVDPAVLLSEVRRLLP